MFNKNHYIFLAKSMKDSKPTGAMDVDVWQRAVHTVAHDLGVDNPRFDKHRFYRDCDAINKESKS